MAERPNLTVVKSTSPRRRKPAAKKVPESISDAVASGTDRDVLAAMRKALAKKLDDGEVSSNAIASAYKELRELDRLIRQLDNASNEGANVTRPSRDRSFNASAI